MKVISLAWMKWLLPCVCLALAACGSVGSTHSFPISISTSMASPPVSSPTSTSLPTIPPAVVPSLAATAAQGGQTALPAVHFRYQDLPGYQKDEKLGQVSLYDPEKGVFIFFVIMTEDHLSYASLDEHLQSFMDNPSKDYNVFNPGECYPYQISGVEGRACDFSGERKSIPMTGRMILAYPTQHTYLFALAFAFDGKDGNGWQLNGLPDSDKLLSSLSVWEQESNE